MANFHNDAKEAFLTYWKQIAASSIEPQPDYKFHPTRKWQFDWAFPDCKVAVEVDGAVYASGRHTRGRGFENDLEKMNEATMRGWRVFRFSTGMLKRNPFACVGYVIGAVKQ